MRDQIGAALFAGGVGLMLAWGVGATLQSLARGNVLLVGALIAALGAAILLWRERE